MGSAAGGVDAGVGSAAWRAAEVATAKRLRRMLFMAGTNFADCAPLSRAFQWH